MRWAMMRATTTRMVWQSQRQRLPLLSGLLTPQHRALSSNREKAAVVAGNFKNYVKKYGWTFVGTYLGIYVTTLASVYLALDFDIFRASDFGFDAKSLTQKACEKVEYYTGIKTLPEFIRQNPWAGVFALAWIMTKFTEPFRVGATLLLVPRIARMLKR